MEVENVVKPKPTKINEDLKATLKAKIESIREKKRKLRAESESNIQFQKQRNRTKNEIGEYLSSLERVNEIELKAAKKMIKLEKKTDMKRYKLESSLIDIYELWGQDACYAIMQIIETLKDEQTFQKKRVKIVKTNKIILTDL